MHYPNSRWPLCCQGKSRDDHDVSGRIAPNFFFIQINLYLAYLAPSQVSPSEYKPEPEPESN